MPVGDCLQHPPSRAVRLGKSAGVAEGAIGDNCNAVVFAPWDHRALDRTLVQMIEHLIADRIGRPWGLAQVVEIVDGEIADAPRQDLADGAELLESGDSIRKRMRAPPVKKIAVESVGLQPFQRPLAGGNRPLARGVVRQHFRHQENLVAPPGDRLPDKSLRRARTVHLRGVHMRHAEVETAAQGRDRSLGIRLLDVPGALADHRDFALRRTERTFLHDLLFAVAGVIGPSSPASGGGGPRVSAGEGALARIISVAVRTIASATSSASRIASSAAIRITVSPRALSRASRLASRWGRSPKSWLIPSISTASRASAQIEVEHIGLNGGLATEDRPPWHLSRNRFHNRASGGERLRRSRRARVIVS